MQDRLVKLLKEADENTANKMITDYEDAIKDNAEYLIANGVIVPPCKVGDKIYFVCGYNMAEYEIYKMEYDELFWKFYCQNDTYVIEHREFVCLYPNTSQTIFFSKEEADQALAKCGMNTCKDCRFFIQGDSKSGTCEKRPYVSTRQGGVQMINGKPRKLYIYCSKTACKMFEKGGE